MNTCGIEGLSAETIKAVGPGTFNPHGPNHERRETSARLADTAQSASAATFKSTDAPGLRMWNLAPPHATDG